MIRKFALHNNARSRFYEREKRTRLTPKKREKIRWGGGEMASEIATIETVETVSTCSSSLPRNESESKMPEDETSGFLEDQTSEGIDDKKS